MASNNREKLITTFFRSLKKPNRIENQNSFESGVILYNIKFIINFTEIRTQTMIKNHTNNCWF